jgi:hypothetical protein
MLGWTAADVPEVELITMEVWGCAVLVQVCGGVWMFSRLAVSQQGQAHAHDGGVIIWACPHNTLPHCWPSPTGSRHPLQVPG